FGSMQNVNKVSDVVVFGGTHGNELSGICLVKKWLSGPPLQSATCKVTATLCNPEAIRLCRRYKDCDINRQFTRVDINKVTNAEENLPYEVKRAKELFSQYSDYSGERIILDLHNTTANVKLCLIVEKPTDYFALHMCRYIQQHFSADFCHILLQGKSYGDVRYIAKHGIGIEVGPQPHGVLRADIFDLQEKAVKLSLAFLDKFNNGDIFNPCEIVTYTQFKKVDFPRDHEGNIAGMIHLDLQDRDWQSVSGSSMVFRTFQGDNVTLEDVVKIPDEIKDLVYPVFVNEASYYEKDLAFWLTKKATVALPILKLNVLH
uniref:Aspartoacylase n=1 Tax=Ciona intestinalis TaxID=7719 RepID=H2Y3S1_CIOIN